MNMKRWTIGIGVCAWVIAAFGQETDRGMVEAAQTPSNDAVREQQILQAIESVRQSHPELADHARPDRSMPDAGAADSHPHTARAAEGGLSVFIEQRPSGPSQRRGDHPLIRDVTFEQIEADPRMQTLREQFESGQLSETDAKNQMLEILREYDRDISRSEMSE